MPDIPLALSNMSPVGPTILLGLAIVAAVAVWVMRARETGDDYDWDI